MRLHLKNSLGMKILMDCVQKWRQLSPSPCSLRYLTTLVLPPPHKLTLPTPHSLTQRYTHTQLSSRESCWKCGQDLNVSSRMEGVRFFCSCDEHVILPPSKTHNYFEIMNCPTTYRIDIDQLKQTFKQLQRQLHPDRFSRKSQVEQDYSSQQSALVNAAYSTLLKPYTRGLYLLELNGLAIDEKDTLMGAPEFLEEMWAVRESIEDASASGDITTLQQLQSTNSVNLNKISDEVEACFQSGDLSAAKECLARMKYFVNIEELLKEVLDLPS